jgi:hypothetical protein
MKPRLRRSRHGRPIEDRLALTFGSLVIARLRMRHPFLVMQMKMVMMQHSLAFISTCPQHTSPSTQKTRPANLQEKLTFLPYLQQPSCRLKLSSLGNRLLQPR